MTNKQKHAHQSLFNNGTCKSIRNLPLALPLASSKLCRLGIKASYTSFQLN